MTAWLRWISRPILLSIRNTFRQKGRLILTIFTLTIAGSIFIAVFNVRDSMENMMDMVMSHFMGDVNVNFSQPYPISRIEQVALTPIDARLIKALLELAERGDDQVTHQQLAVELGTAREVVSRHLKKLEREGLLALGRGRIVIQDKAKLRMLQEKALV